jgi:hypothetical protein
MLSIRERYNLSDANRVQTWSRLIRRSGYVFRHYWLVLPDSLQVEIHPGNYHLGSIHNMNTTKHGELSSETILCAQCTEELLNSISQMPDLWYFPLINCESLSRGLIGGSPVSTQVIVTTFAIVCLLFSMVYFPLLFIGLGLFVAMVIVNKWSASITQYAKCNHVV